MSSGAAAGTARCRRAWSRYGSRTAPRATASSAAARRPRRRAFRVLVTGGGPVGQAAVLAARRVGAVSVVSEPDPRRRELISELGSATVDPSQDDVPAASTELLGGQATVAIDAVGLSASMADCLTATAPGSRIVLVGMHDQRLDVPAYAISTAERVIIGSFCYTARDFRETAAWVGDAGAELATLIDTRIDIAEAATTFAEAAARGSTGPGKVLVYPGGLPAPSTSESSPPVANV